VSIIVVCQSILQFAFLSLFSFIFIFSLSHTEFAVTTSIACRSHHYVWKPLACPSSLLQQTATAKKKSANSAISLLAEKQDDHTSMGLTLTVA
jgi:hypothetical protein